MIEGLWTVEFESSSGYIGAGVVVTMKNRIIGGDNQYVYTGTYELSGFDVTAHVEAVAFLDDEPTSIFGTHDRKFTVSLVGKIKENQIEAHAFSGDLRFRFRKHRELP